MELERWTPREVERSQLLNAPYNPRVIGDKERRKLRAQIAKNGMVAPITWNVRTGHIVGGHERIAAIDAIMKSKDYKLTVAEIDVDESDEKAINIALNNDDIMGEFDMAKLGKMLEDTTIDLDKAGFDASDMFEMFGYESMTKSAERIEALTELGAKMKEIRTLYRSLGTSAADREGPEFFAVLVGRSEDELDGLLKALKLDNLQRYHALNHFVAAIEARFARAHGIEYEEPAPVLALPTKARRKAARGRAQEGA